MILIFGLTEQRRMWMVERKEIFADGIGQIHFVGGMVRYDFITLNPIENGKNPEVKASVRVIMPPQGFLNTFNSMQQLIDKLIDAGVLTKNESKKGKEKKK